MRVTDEGTIDVVFVASLTPLKKTDRDVLEAYTAPACVHVPKEKLDVEIAGAFWSLAFAT